MSPELFLHRHQWNTTSSYHNFLLYDSITFFTHKAYLFSIYSTQAFLHYISVNSRLHVTENLFALPQ